MNTFKCGQVGRCVGQIKEPSGVILKGGSRYLLVTVALEVMIEGEGIRGRQAQGYRLSSESVSV